MIQGLVHSLKIFTIVATAVLVAFGGRSFFDYYTAKEADPLLGQPITLTVAEEDDADSLAPIFREVGLIRSELVFKTEMRLNSGLLQPGTYTLRRGMSVREIVDVITVSTDAEGDDGDEVEAREVEFRVEEAWRTEEIAEAYADLGLEADFDAFMAATENISTRRYDFLDDRPDGAGLEGFLFPDTYTFGSNASPEDVIYYMLDTFDAKFTPQMRERAAELGLSLYDVVILASIVEREAGNEEERPMIAAVYLNRLELDEPMMLQADPTVIYTLGTADEWWPKLKADQQYEPGVEDSPYNTYTHHGLPPTPICNPSLASIKAVLYPADEDYLFFVATGDGETHLFASTFEEHEANIDRVEGN